MPKNATVLFAITLLQLVGVGGFYATSSLHNGGFVYPLDDAYIHLGLARRLVESGTWGVNPGEFVSASSSPVWTAILAIAHSLWPDPRVALSLATIAGISAMWLGLRLSGSTVAVFLMWAFVPIPYLSSLGMEHVLHLTGVMWLVLLVFRQSPHPLLVALVAALLVLIRFESIFVLMWLPILSPNRKLGLAAAAGGAAGFLGFGLFSVSQGGLFVPNSLLMKSFDRGYFRQLTANIQEGAPVWVLVAATIALMKREHREARLFVAAAVTHLLFARVGWLARYEAWLIGWGLVTLIPIARDSERWKQAAMLGVMGIPFLHRSIHSIREFPTQSRFVFDSNVQGAQFIAEHLPTARVAAHDLGALAYFTDAYILDVGGLASTPVTKAHLAQALTGEFFNGLLQDREIDVALVLTRWLSVGADLQPVARMQLMLPDGTEVHSLTIATTKPAYQQKLTQALGSLESSPTSRLVWEGTRPISPEQLQLEGEVQSQSIGYAFFGNGAIRTRLSQDARLFMDLSSDVGGAEPARLEVVLDGQPIDVVEVTHPKSIGPYPASSGSTFELRFTNDFADGSGDRNLYLRHLEMHAQGDI